MDADEAVRVDLGLIAGCQLLATVHVHRSGVSGGERRHRRAIGRREKDLLRRQLRRDLVVNEGVPPEQESRAEDQDADEAGLEYQHSPPHSVCHFSYLHRNLLPGRTLQFSISSCGMTLDGFRTEGPDLVVTGSC